MRGLRLSALRGGRGLASSASSVDAGEVAKFASLGGSWWGDRGSAAGPLHEMNLVRAAYVRRRAGPLEGLAVADVGCGGGLLSEALARMGARVTAVDPSPENVAAARAHSAQDPATADIEYLAQGVEELEAEGRRFDLVCSLEVCEHAADPADFLRRCSRLVRPGGSAVFSTINRTAEALALAVVGAEYVARVLPVGTHEWGKFVRPDEMAAAGRAEGLVVEDTSGLVYSLRRRKWELSAADTRVNYVMHLSRPPPCA